MKSFSSFVGALLSVALLAACSGNSASTPVAVVPSSRADSLTANRSSASVAPETRHNAVTFKSLFSFNPGDGANPIASLTYVGGLLYGTTESGGLRSGAGGGTVFTITPSGTQKVLHIFGNAGDGAVPTAALKYVKGALYGTTSQGGASGVGTVFRITASGNEKILHSFGGTGDGASPWATLTDVEGALYGTTVAGGAHYSGTVYTIATSGVERVLYNFKGLRSDGERPLASPTA